MTNLQRTFFAFTLTGATLASLVGCRTPQSISSSQSEAFYGRAQARSLVEEMPVAGASSIRDAEVTQASATAIASDSEDNLVSDSGNDGGGADGVARLSSPVLAANRAAPAGSASHPHIAPVQGTPNNLSPITFSQAQPRLPVNDDGSPVGEPAVSWMIGRESDKWPDEYLADGGDRGYPVHYDPYHRLGLNTEDTVAEFRDSDGKPVTQSTNRVTIYAPRFGSVRTIVTPSGDLQIARASGMQDRVVNSDLGTRVGPDDYTRNDRLRGIRVRSRASGVETREWERGVFNTARLAKHTKLSGLREDLSYWLSSSFEQSDKARLADGIDAALLWTRNENPVMTARVESLGQVEVKFRAAEMVGTEPEENEPGRLKIVKLADTKTAKPGDTITFVIRYDNVGERPLHDLRIVDNLTSRLEYIEDSATSDRAGDITLEDNAEGSAVLTFQFDQPLLGGKGGAVTFQCKVR
jgi:uncharacterized repeat protein (TIGR01451 family)